MARIFKYKPRVRNVIFQFAASAELSGVRRFRMQNLYGQRYYSPANFHVRCRGNPVEKGDPGRGLVLIVVTPTVDKELPCPVVMRRLKIGHPIALEELLVLLPAALVFVDIENVIDAAALWRNLIVLPHTNSTLPMIPAETGHRYTVEFAMNAFLGRLAKNSRATVLHGLRKAADELGYEDAPLQMVPWERIGAPELIQLVQRWRGTVTNASIRIYIYSVRGVVESCVTHNLVHRDQYEPMRKVRAPKGTNRIGLGQYVKERDRRQLLQSCGEDERKVLGKRDKAMLSILFGSGVRRSEATRLEIQDLNLDEGMFQVVVKGHHLVEKYLAAWAIEPLREWVAELASLNIRSGPILRRMSKGGKPLSPMSPNGLWRALGERCLYAGVPAMKPHDARRTLATDLINEHGLNIAKIALGHANIATTAIYDMTDKNIMKNIFGKKTG